MLKKGLRRNRVVLLYPPISKLERYSSDIGNAGGDQIPLGIFSIAAYLREGGYEVMVIDAEAERIDGGEIVRRIRRFKAAYLGVSSTTVAFHRAVEVVKLVKEVLPKITIILGGPHVTSNVEQAMSFSEFDFGVLREGELTILELLARLKKGRKELKTIKGIAFRQGKELVVTGPREYVKDLDSLPFPAYDLIGDISRYAPPPSNYKELPVVSVITSRGCPNQCTFCDRNVFGQTYREMSAERVVELLKYLWKKYRFKEVAFVDDTFLINKKRLYAVFGLLEKEGMHFHWTCMSRVNVVNEEILRFIKSKGCWHISFGIESGDEKILELIKKNISLKQVVEVTKMCSRLGIKTKGFFIVGHPGDTLRSIEKTIKFATMLKIDDIVTTINTPIPGSPQYGFIRQYGTFDETDWSQFNYWRPVFIPKGLTKEILLKKQREMYRRFYLRPRVLWRYLKSFMGSGGWRRFKSVALASLYLVNGSKKER